MSRSASIHTLSASGSIPDSKPETGKARVKHSGGYVALPHTVQEALYLSDLNGTQHAILHALMRLTWRNHRDFVNTSGKRLAGLMKRHPKLVERELRNLTKKQVVLHVEGEYGINKAVGEWQTGEKSASAKRRAEAAVQARESAQQAPVPVAAPEPAPEPTPEPTPEPAQAHRQPTGSQTGDPQVTGLATKRYPNQEPTGAHLYKTSLKTPYKTSFKPVEVSTEADVEAEAQAESQALDAQAHSLKSTPTLLAHIQQQYPQAAIATRSGKAMRWGTELDQQLAELMHQQVVKVTLDRRPLAHAILASWANEIRLMREQDHRSHEQIWALFQWAHTETGWGKWRENILSPSALRRCWGKLAAGYNADRRRLESAIAPSLQRQGSSDAYVHRATRQSTRASDSWGDGINDL